MNRIVLIGNGFDLAHGLKTSYADFIDWYFEKKFLELQEEYSGTLDDGLTKFELKDCSWVAFFMNYRLKGMNDLLDMIQYNQDSMKRINHPFFDFIQKQYKEKGWVDIENEYYKCLISKKNPAGALNIELDIIRQKLIEYLREVQNANETKVIDEIKAKIIEPFRTNDIAVNSFKIFKDIINERFNYDDTKLNELIGCFKQYYLFYSASNVHDYQKKGLGIEDLKTDVNFPKELLLPDKILLLNFNYTNIADNYFPDEFSYRFQVNHIHGSLDIVDSVIFGYGDEDDEAFKELQKRNDIESLKNIKTIKYLEYSNYKDLLSFVESAPYQVLIMGHSCGQSDGTMLNTLFEHKNCMSIKPYYYKMPDGTDNYMEISQNISRNFTDMKLMRDRVVNKSQCEPLPQKQCNQSN